VGSVHNLKAVNCRLWRWTDNTPTGP